MVVLRVAWCGIRLGELAPAQQAVLLQPGYPSSMRPAHVARELDGLKVIIPHHETFSATIQSPYSSTKG
jgi:hypothetical protein